MQIINAFLVNEHEDNRRFAQDCKAWSGQPITVLRDDKYGADALEGWVGEEAQREAIAQEFKDYLERNVQASAKLALGSFEAE